MDRPMHVQLEQLASRAQGPLLFWCRTLRHPRQVCSLFPSSPFVGRAMTNIIRDRVAPHVVELGAGTGAITRQLIRAGIPPKDLTLVEIDSHLGGHLRRNFPELDVIISPAQDLGRLWTERNGPDVGAIVSTLPMRLLSKPVIRSIMKSSFQVLVPGGLFVQFTYRNNSPVPLRIAKALGLTAERKCLVLANIPPAAIWVYQRVD